MSIERELIRRDALRKARRGCGAGNAVAGRGGRPLTEEERRRRHKRLTGEDEPPPRGAGRREGLRKARGREGLTPQKKTVTRGGRTFQTTVYVRSGEKPAGDGGKKDKAAREKAGYVFRNRAARRIFSRMEKFAPDPFGNKADRAAWDAAEKAWVDATVAGATKTPADDAAVAAAKKARAAHAGEEFKEKGAREMKLSAEGKTGVKQGEAAEPAKWSTAGVARAAARDAARKMLAGAKAGPKESGAEAAGRRDREAEALAKKIEGAVAAEIKGLDPKKSATLSAAMRVARAEAVRESGGVASASQARDEIDDPFVTEVSQEMGLEVMSILGIEEPAGKSFDEAYAAGHNAYVAARMAGRSVKQAEGDAVSAAAAMAERMKEEDPYDEFRERRVAEAQARAKGKAGGPKAAASKKKMEGMTVGEWMSEGRPRRPSPRKRGPAAPWLGPAEKSTAIGRELGRREAPKGGRAPSKEKGTYEERMHAKFTGALPRDERRAEYYKKNINRLKNLSAKGNETAWETVADMELDRAFGFPKGVTMRIRKTGKGWFAVADATRVSTYNKTPEGALGSALHWRKIGRTEYGKKRPEARKSTAIGRELGRREALRKARLRGLI